jgi:hypothetical protein
MDCRAKWQSRRAPQDSNLPPTPLAPANSPTAFEERKRKEKKRKKKRKEKKKKKKKKIKRKEKKPPASTVGACEFTNCLSRKKKNKKRKEKEKSKEKDRPPAPLAHALAHAPTGLQKKEKAPASGRGEPV